MIWSYTKNCTYYAAIKIYVITSLDLRSFENIYTVRILYADMNRTSNPIFISSTLCIRHWCAAARRQICFETSSMYWAKYELWNSDTTCLNIGSPHSYYNFLKVTQLERLRNRVSTRSLSPVKLDQRTVIGTTATDYKARRADTWESSVASGVTRDGKKFDEIERSAGVQSPISPRPFTAFGAGDWAQAGLSRRGFFLPLRVIPLVFYYPLWAPYVRIILNTLASSTVNRFSEPKYKRRVKTWTALQAKMLKVVYYTTPLVAGKYRLQ